ncbi:MAG: hypothetical protein HYU37_03620 [Acidobacteria bacterium]|nr:hypothetical protein [Acidobacteriota bacterium]
MRGVERAAVSFPHKRAEITTTGAPPETLVRAVEKAGYHAAVNEPPKSRAALPRVTFTDPQVASVGVTEEEARTNGLDVMVSRLPLSYVPRALAARETRGLIKLVADRRTNRLVGAHILATEAGEMIQEPTLAIKYGISVDDLAAAFHPYLTLAEGIKLAAQTFTKDVKKLSCCAA